MSEHRDYHNVKKMYKHSNARQNSASSSYKFAQVLCDPFANADTYPTCYSLHKTWPATNVAKLDKKQQFAKVNLSTRLRRPWGLSLKIKEHKLKTTINKNSQSQSGYRFYHVNDTKCQDLFDVSTHVDHLIASSIMRVHLFKDVPLIDYNVQINDLRFTIELDSGSC